MINFISNNFSKSLTNNLKRTFKMKIIKIKKIFNNYIDKYIIYKKD